MELDRISVEVCCTSVEEAMAADTAGADSIELCSWLGCGGITPSHGTVLETISRIQAKVRVLIRAVPGAFTYSEVDRSAMIRDAELLAAHPGIGLVIGALDPDGLPDVAFIRSVQRAAPHHEITFHRAIDTSSDLLRSTVICRELGVQRILTSGGAPTAVAGMPLIRSMVDEAGHMIVAAGAGIHGGNVIELVSGTGVGEVHFSAQLPAELPDRMPHPDTLKIEQVLERLRKAGFRS